MVRGETAARTFNSCPYWLRYKDIYSKITQFEDVDLEGEIQLLIDSSI